jgi:F420-dependent oxidoreductase-like protein
MIVVLHNYFLADWGMRIGLSIADFTVPGGSACLGPELARVARAADQLGFCALTVMDHYFQIGMIGPPEAPMLEGYTTLGYLAASTQHLELGTLATGVHYRHPGLLAKIVTTLDVLSGGRAFLGIGAGWNELESRGLGVPFPPLGERFERLQETLKICLQMWEGDEQPVHARHYQLQRPLNSPQSLSRPHPPIVVAGSGERKTLRLVARYADGCNLFPGPQLPHKLEVLRRYCDELGRDYAAIEKTSMYTFDASGGDAAVASAIDALREMAVAGIETVYFGVVAVFSLRPLEIVAERIMPAVADL